jgi:glycosyltransferase involved in cell wall biosynthesis
MEQRPQLETKLYCHIAICVPDVTRAMKARNTDWSKEWFVRSALRLESATFEPRAMETTARSEKTTDCPIRISVAMATYNGEKHIREQLDSIARQTLLPFELVITDDASTDATLQIVEEFAQTAPFSVTMIRNEKRLGYADNFMKAASLCAGDLIAFCDQDDIWMEQKLSICSSFFTDPDVQLIAHSAVVLLPNGGRGHRHPNFAKTTILMEGSANPFNFAYGFALIFRRVLLDIASIDCRPANVRGHDQWLWFLACSAGRIALIEDALTLYRQHTSNAFGAPQRLTFAQRLRRTAGIIDFDGLANSELQCSSLLVAAASTCPQFSAQLKDSAESLALRSKLHRLRTTIYRENSDFLLRAGVFTRILLTGGYLPDSSGTRLGPYHGMKDLFLGVMGTYQILNSAARS